MRLNFFAALLVLIISCGSIGSVGTISTSFSVVNVPEDATHIRTQVTSVDGSIQQLKTKPVSGDSTTFTYRLGVADTYNVNVVTYNSQTGLVKTIGQADSIEVLPTSIKTTNPQMGSVTVSNWSFDQQQNFLFSLSLDYNGNTPERFFAERTVQFGSSALEYQKPLSDSLTANLTEIEGDNIDTVRIQTVHSLADNWSVDGDSLRLRVPEDSTFKKELEGVLEIIVGDLQSNCAVNVENATIHYPSSANHGPIAVGDTVAMFTSDNECAGYRIWSSEGAVLAAAGKDDFGFTPNGFDKGEEFKIAVKDGESGETHVYDPSIRSCNEMEIPVCRDDGRYEDGTFQEITGV